MSGKETHDAAGAAMLSERLRMHVERLAGLIGPRHLGRPGTIDATLALIEREFAAIGDAVVRQQYAVEPQTATNLVVERRGKTRPDEIVILGAHYDTVPETPGADDNASAVAVLIEAARLTKPLAFGRTVRFVAFACEEPPHFFTSGMGSVVYAERCRQRAERIVGSLRLEMVGYFSDAPESQACPKEISRWLRWVFPRRGDFLAAVGNLASWRLCWSFRHGFRQATELPLFAIALPEAVHSIRLSDNASFWEVGYPALMITDTSFLRNPHYHRATDLPDTLDYARMAEVTAGVVGALRHLCRSPAAPHPAAKSSIVSRWRGSAARR